MSTAAFAFEPTRVRSCLLALLLSMSGGCQRVPLDVGGECELNTDCQTPLVCRLGHCRVECRAQRDCAAGLECVRDARMLGGCQLAEETACALNTECPDPLVCRFGRCTNACVEDVDCPPGAQCLADEDGAYGCRDGFERQCTYNSECADPLICAVDHRCRPQCRADRDCRDGRVCDVGADPHVCVPPSDVVDGGLDDGGGLDGATPSDASTTDGGPLPDGGDAGVASATSPPLPRMAAGIDHTCAALTASDLRCWGENRDGQVGRGDLMTAYTPFALTSISGVTVVGGGATHSCAATGTGLSCWGLNTDGQVGAGSGGAMRYLSPNPVAGLPSAPTDLALGNAHSCAIASGRLFCWGDNQFGQLGDGTLVDRPSPVEVTGLSAAPAEVTAFSNHTCVRLATGAVECFGDNAVGQLGDGSGMLMRTSPVAVSGLTDAVQIAVGTTHSCALRATGQVVCWGDNTLGQLGTGTFGGRATTPTPIVPPSSAPRQLALGSTHSCVRTDSGAACWGDNIYGQCGANPAMGTRFASPRDVAGLGAIDEIRTGSLHTCVRNGTTTIRCFGTNGQGQLGIGAAGADSYSPVTVSWT